MKVKRKNLWMIIGVVVIGLLIYGGNWAYNTYQDSKKEQKIAEKVQSYKLAVEENPDDMEVLLAYGIVLHDTNQIDEAIEVLKKVLETDAKNPMARGYLGSSLTKKANELEDIALKVETLQEGIDILDKNVKDNPDHFGARMIRAENNYYLPKMFNRLKISIADFNHLLTLVHNDSSSKTIPYLKYRLLQCYVKNEQVDQAKEILSQMIQEYPDHLYTEKAKEILKD